MPSTYSTRLNVTKQGTGDNSGTWGAVLNDQTIELLDEAIAGVQTLNVTTGINITLSTANGATSQARKAVLRFSGTPTADISVIIPSVEKTYDIDGTNFLGVRTITVRAATGAGVSFTAGQKGRVYFNGTDVVDIFKTTILGNLATKNTVGTVDIDNLSVTLDKISQINSRTILGNVSLSTSNVSEIAIATDLISNSDDVVPTQKAVKTAVDVVTNSLGMARAWVAFDSAGTILSSYGVTSVSKISTGVYDVNLATSFTSKDKMCPIIQTTNLAGTTYNIYGRWDRNGSTTNKVRIISMYQEDNGYGIANVPADDSRYLFTLFGDIS